MSTDSTNPSTAPTTEMNGLTLNPSSSSSVSPSPASTPAGERVEGSSSSSNGDRSGETTPRGEEGGVTPQAIPQSTTQQQQAAASTVLARDMVHGSPASPQIISPPSTSDASSTATPIAAASGSTTASPASRLSQARPAPGIGGLAARGGRPGLGGGLSAGGQGGGSKLPPSLQAKIDVSCSGEVELGGSSRRAGWLMRSVGVLRVCFFLGYGDEVQARCIGSWRGGYELSSRFRC